MDQEITQIGLSDYELYQNAYESANDIDEIYGDYNSVTQGILQLGLAYDEVYQVADGSANEVEYAYGDYFTLDQDITQAGISSTYEIYQDADAGNFLSEWDADYGPTSIRRSCS